MVIYRLMSKDWKRQEHDLKGKSMALKAKSNDTDESFDDEDSEMKTYITR